jgi:hypothetical protein
MIFDYRVVAEKFTFNSVPFTRVKALKYMYVNGLPFQVFFKESFDVQYTEATILRTTSLSCKVDLLPLPKILKCGKGLSDDEKKYIETMLRFMPTEDRMFMKSLCKI